MAARRTRTVVMTAALAAIAGCATARTPAELVMAREAFDRARYGETPNLAPAEVEQARRTLNAAERAYADDSKVAPDIAYLAMREAELAEAKAGALLHARQAERAEQAVKIELELRARVAEEAAERARANAEAERAARMEAERIAREALAKLKDVTVEVEARGTVIALPGEVLFAAGKSDLLPKARERLDAIAEALEVSDGRVVIEGHTDAKGRRPEADIELAQRRAEAVRDYLASRGLPAERLDARGVTSEGRATNRRMEIIIEATEEPASPSPHEERP